LLLVTQITEIHIFLKWQIEAREQQLADASPSSAGARAGGPAVPVWCALYPHPGNDTVMHSRFHGNAGFAVSQLPKCDCAVCGPSPFLFFTWTSFPIGWNIDTSHPFKKIQKTLLSSYKTSLGSLFSLSLLV
jgi:hypothetical protein